MRIIDKGIDETFVKHQMEMSDNERQVLLEYARQYMSVQQLEEFQINWAVNTLLREHIQREEKPLIKMIRTGYLTAKEFKQKFGKENKMSKGQDKKKEKKKPKKEKK